MPNLIASQKFIKALSAMSKNEQRRISLALTKLQSDPRHNSLRTKKIQALNNILKAGLQIRCGSSGNGVMVRFF